MCSPIPLVLFIPSNITQLPILNQLWAFRAIHVVTPALAEVPVSPYAFLVKQYLVREGKVWLVFTMSHPLLCSGLCLTERLPNQVELFQVRMLMNEVSRAKN